MPAVVDAVAWSLSDADDVVRLAAVEALGNADPAVRQRFLPRMLDDPVRAVRIEPARVPKAASLHHALALVLVRQKRTAVALRELAEAARLDPASARYACVWAVALNDTGGRKEALSPVPRGCRNLTRTTPTMDGGGPPRRAALNGTVAGTAVGCAGRRREIFGVEQPGFLARQE
jgi:hypothetical protein